MKNQLFALAFLCLFFNTISAQTDSTSIFEIKIYDDVTDVPLPTISVTFVKKGIETAYFRTKPDGTYKVELNEGKYKMYVTHRRFKGKTIDVKIKAGETVEQIVKLTELAKAIPEEPGEAIPGLYGFWRVLCIDDGKNKIRQPKQIAQSGIAFSKLDKHKPGIGNVSFNEGCKSIRGLWFKHHGNGEIEMPTGITESYDVGCAEYNHEIRKLIPKLIDRFHVSFINDDQIKIKNEAIEIRLKRVR